jgi:hypothetical protein
VVVSNASEGLDRLRDHDLGSSWSTVRPQKGGDWIELTWKEPRTVAAIRMALGPRSSDFPIALRVDVKNPSGEWETRPESSPVSSAVETLVQLVGRDPEASVTVRIEPVETLAIRLVLDRDADRPPWNPWSVAEIHFFSGCVAPPTPGAERP